MCSEFASIEHTWRNCSSGTRKYLNCGDAHRTMTYKFSTRKKLTVNDNIVSGDNKSKEIFSQAAVKDDAMSL